MNKIIEGCEVPLTTECAVEGTHDRVKAMVHSLAANASNHSALDAPCGPGSMSVFLARLGYSVQAIDLVPPEFGEFCVKPVRSDLDNSLPYTNGTFDLCVSIEGIEHLERPADFFAELVRVTKPGGNFFLTTPNCESIKSRLRVFKYGFPKYFGPISDTERDSGHVHAIDRVFIERHYRRHGLVLKHIGANSLSGKRMPWRLLGRLLTKRLPKMYRDENVLFGDVLIYHFQKPK